MWARSICYRLWISGGFPVSFMLRSKSPLDAGWARRLCSGSLLQFTTREDFYENDIPSLGFYGHREFAIQNYSCPASPFIDRKSTRLNSSHLVISYAVFCLKK